MPIVKAMMQHYPGIKMKRFPLRCAELDFEKDILPAENKIIEEYGFVKEEVNFIMKYKPSFILFEQEGENTGLKMIHSVIV